MLKLIVKVFAILENKPMQATAIIIIPTVKFKYIAIKTENQYSAKKIINRKVESTKKTVLRTFLYCAV